MAGYIFWAFLLLFLGALCTALGAAAAGRWPIFKIAYCLSWALVGAALLFMLSGRWGTHGSESEGLAWGAMFVVRMGAPAAVAVGLIAALASILRSRTEED